MPGIKALRKLQVGKEASTDPGTGVAATALLRFEGLWKDELKIEFPMENVGYISGRDRAYISQYLASMAMSGPATFEQFPYILEAGIAAVTPTTDSGSGFIYTYTLPTTSQGTINTYTIEGGDDQQEEEASYGYCADFTLAGRFAEVWNLESNWFGRQVTPSNFTADSDVVATEVEEMLFQKSRLYIDNDTDAIGTTQKSNTFLQASLKVKTGWRHQFTGGNRLDFSFIKRPTIEALLDITFEHDGSATAEKTAWRAKTARLIRILVEGSALATPGTYTYKTCRIDLAGKWETFDVLGEEDGNDIVTGTFRARYNANAALFGQIVVVNELASLP